MVHAWRASIELWMHAGSWESTREVFEWHEAKLSASLASRVLSQLPKCIHNLIDVQLKYGPFLLEHCYFKCKLIKYRILLNHSECFDWLMQSHDLISMHLSRFRCTLAPYKKRARNTASYVLIFFGPQQIDGYHFWEIHSLFYFHSHEF